MSVQRKNDRAPVVVEHCWEGKGSICRTPIVPEEQLYGKGTLFVEMEIQPGNSIGYHQHVGTCETYLVLQGKAIYNDNGTEVTLNPGDVAHCPEGTFHGIEAVGDEVFKMIALVTYVDK